MKTTLYHRLILFSIILLNGLCFAQNENKPIAFNLSEMTEADRNKKIEEIALQALRDNIDKIKKVYSNDPENLPRIDLTPGSNRLRWENIEKKVWKAEFIQATRDIYKGVITDRNLNPGDIVYIARFTPNSYFAWPITYSVLLFDDGKPISIGFDDDTYFLNIYKNDTLPAQLPVLIKQIDPKKLK